MGRYRQVFNAYVTRWQFWLCVFIWVSQFGAFVSTSTAEKAARVLPFALGFGLIYVNGALGIQVKEHLASYRALLTPGYLCPHLVWAAVWLSLIIVPFAIAAAAKSLSVVSVLGLGLLFAGTAFAAACRGGWRALVLGILFFGILTIPALDSSPFLIPAANPWIPACLGFVGLLWLYRTFRFLATVTEERPGYTGQWRSNLRAYRGAYARRSEAAAIQRLEDSHSIWLRFVDWTTPTSRIYVGDSRWKRIRHWRRAHANWWAAALMPCVVWSVLVAILLFIQRGAGHVTAVFRGSFWPAVLMPQMVFINAWHARARLLSREMLYPVRRKDLVLEQGVAVLGCQLLSWGLLMLEIAAVLSLLPGQLPPGHLQSLILLTGAWQLLALGVCARLTSMRSAVPLILAVMLNMVVGNALVIVCMTFYTMTLLSCVTGGVLVLGACAMFLAYDHWLTVDIT